MQQSVSVLSFSKESSVSFSLVAGVLLLLVVVAHAWVGSGHVASETLVGEFFSAVFASFHAFGVFFFNGFNDWRALSV